MPEFTCDVLQIDAGHEWRAREWARTPENGNVWLSGGPSPRAVELMNGGALQRGAVDLAPVGTK